MLLPPGMQMSRGRVGSIAGEGDAPIDGAVGLAANHYSFYERLQKQADHSLVVGFQVCLQILGVPDDEVGVVQEHQMVV